MKRRIVPDLQPGDTARIRQWDDMEAEFGINDEGHIKCEYLFSTHMEHLCGELVIVTRVSGSHISLSFMSLTQGSTDWSYSLDMLEYPNEF